MIGVSGAVLDTGWIKPNRTYPALLLQHGTSDGVVPFMYDHPFHIPTLPALMGSYLINQRCQNLGLRCELETWVGAGHVPFLGSSNGLNWAALFTRNPLGIVLNPFVLDSTKRHIANFIYSLINCDAQVTGIREHVATDVSVYPNPSTGNFTICIPKENGSKWLVSIYNVEGREQYQHEFPGNMEFITINEKLPPSSYFIKLKCETGDAPVVYTGKITIAQ
jgi:hypothetical protein